MMPTQCCPTCQRMSLAWNYHLGYVCWPCRNAAEEA